ncbi:TRI59 protein, partial [Serilophus lunatus]|nr:TRI59 protein [Serilophus lunatus]
MDRLEEELTCAVCCGIFEEPRVLPCSHTFCAECLEELLQHTDGFSLRRRLKCPSCRALLDVPAGKGLESLPVNFALKAVIEKCRREEPWSVGSCREHPRQPLNIYCVLDQRLVCGQCLTRGQHRGHPIADLQSAFGNAREAAGKLQEQLGHKFWREVVLCQVRLSLQRSQCESLVSSQREFVESYFGELGAALEHKKQALLGALDQLKSSYLEEHEPLVENLSKLKAEETELQSLNSSIQAEKCPRRCLEKLEQLRGRVEALQQMELPTVKPLEIDPRMEKLLEDKWGRTALGQVHKMLPLKLKLIPRRKLHNKCPGKGRDCKAQLQAVPIPTTLLLWGEALGAAPAVLWEFLLRVFQDSCSHLHRAVARLCHTFTSLLEFCRSLVPL